MSDCTTSAGHGYDIDQLWVCYYCGEVATTLDHAVPKSMLEDLRILGDPEVYAALVHRNRVMVVDACRDCNSRLSNSYSQTLSDRRELLRFRLRKAYVKLLSMPDWSDGDLGRMGRNLLEYVAARQVKRDRIRKRLTYDGPATRYGVRLR